MTQLAIQPGRTLHGVRHIASVLLLAAAAASSASLALAGGGVTASAGGGDVAGPVPVADLVDGVASIATGGNPASLVAWGEARVLSVRDDGTVLAAAAPFGRGRVVALGHGGFLSDERGDTPRFIANCLGWLAGDGPAARSIRVAGLSVEQVERAGRGGLSLERVPGGPPRIELASTDVLVGSPQAWHGAGRLDELAAWLRGGGSMLVTETAWGQLQLGRATDVDDLAANRLLSEAGIMFTADAESAGRAGTYAVGGDRLAAANAESALAVLAGAEPGDAAFASVVVRDALSLVPLDGPLVAAVDRLRVARAAELDRAWAAMADGPLQPKDHPLAIALLDLDGRRAVAAAASGDVGAIAAHPSAAAFPGSVDAEFAAANRGTHVLHLDSAIPGWRSTGLYALPGEPVEVRFTGTWGNVAAAANAGIHLQIGAWRDPQNFAPRVRMPKAIVRTPVRDAITRTASPIGGPLLIDLPEGFASRPHILERVAVLVTGAVPMPHYRLGETDIDDWVRDIRQRPVPWAELESDELVFTVPAAAVRDLDRPDLVMEHWDRVHAAMQQLEPRTANHWSGRQYRYVADRKLSWGWMYCPANGPIVIPEVTAAAIGDAANFDAEGGNDVWGHYHEMGHAHQNPMWTFGGTGEVTVNIFTVLALHRVNGYPLDDPATRSDPATAWRTFEEHLKAGAPFDVWKRKPFLALQTYAMLWHAFGFDAFERCFRAYDAIPPEERPKNDAEKRDRFVVEMSRAVGRNLGPYFQAWGVPVSDAARAEIGGLPGWMPEASAAGD